jgi:hypothetical protein
VKYQFEKQGDWINVDTLQFTSLKLRSLIRVET